MTNRLLSDWHLRIKLVDDTSALEIIPRNALSLLNCAASDIHYVAIAHNMKLNPTKFKEMFVNFLHNRNVLLNSIIIGNNVIEQVKCYKILGVILSNDLKWNSVDYIVKKAFLMVLRRADVCRARILNGTTYYVEYAVPMW